MYEVVIKRGVKGLKEYAEKKGRENPVKTAAIFSFLAAKARVAMYYYFPPVEDIDLKSVDLDRIRLPRTEILLPFEASPENIKEYIDDSIMLPIDRRFYSYYPSSELGEHPVIVPQPIFLSHRIAKDYAKLFVSASEDYLRMGVEKYIKDILDILKEKLRQRTVYGAYLSMFLREYEEEYGRG